MQRKADSKRNIYKCRSSVLFLAYADFPSHFSEKPYLLSSSSLQSSFLRLGEISTLSSHSLSYPITLLPLSLITPSSYQLHSPAPLSLHHSNTISSAVLAPLQQILLSATSLPRGTQFSWISGFKSCAKLS